MTDTKGRKALNHLHNMQYLNRPTCESSGDRDWSKWIPRLLCCVRKPPQRFMDACVEEANKFHSVRNARWVQDDFDGSWLLTGDELPKRDGSYVGEYRFEACANLFEGLYKGLVMGLPKPKPYFADLPKVTTARHVTVDSKSYELPHVGKPKRVWFETEDEMKEAVSDLMDAYELKVRDLWEVRRSLEDQGVTVAWSLDLVYGYDFDRDHPF